MYSGTLKCKKKELHQSWERMNVITVAMSKGGLSNLHQSHSLVTELKPS